jgi:hypothetical protein
MFWGAGLVALPLTLGYTLIVYHLFRGKMLDTELRIANDMQRVAREQSAASEVQLPT